MIMPFTVNINGDFAPELVGSLANAFQQIPQGTQRLIININSGGGAVLSAIAVYNMIKQMPYTVETHNMSDVSSAAILPFLAGSIRTAEPISRFMFHPFVINGDGAMSYATVMEKLKILEADLENYAKIVRTEAPAFCAAYDIIDVLKNQTIIITNAEEGRRLGILTENAAKL